MQKRKYIPLCWIAWEKHRRTIELCDFLGIEPTLFLSDLPRLFKHPYLIVRTFFFLIMNRLDCLIIQNPSIFLALLACLLHRFLKYKLIVDTHNAGLAPESFILRKLTWLYKYFQQEADLTIVTTESLATTIKKYGNVFELPDKVPDFSNLHKIKLKGEYNIVYICTFEKDEPFKEVIKIGKRLPKDITLYITGDYKKASMKTLNDIPEQIILTGYLSEQKYLNMLFSADLVMDLTNRENCLVCGGYEGVAVKTPLILSKTKVLRDFFYKGAVYTTNKSEDILKNINYALSNLILLNSDINDLNDEMKIKWKTLGESFKQKTCINQQV